MGGIVVGLIRNLWSGCGGWLGSCSVMGFAEPAGIVALGDNLFVADEKADRVLILSLSPGTYGEVIGSLTRGLRFPRGLTVDEANGRLYVCQPTQITVFYVGVGAAATGAAVALGVFPLTVVDGDLVEATDIDHVPDPQGGPGWLFVTDDQSHSIRVIELTPATFGPPSRLVVRERSDDVFV